MRTAWNKGLTKQTDKRVLKYSKSLSVSKKGIPSLLKGKGIIKEKQYIALNNGDISLRINLTQGKFAIIDEEDFEKVNQFKWRFHSGGYANTHNIIKGKDKNLYLHRLILNIPKNKQVDHINGDKLDNRKSNLRLATHAENMRNIGIKVDNKTGHKGVYRDKREYLKKRCQAHIKINGKIIHLGYYKTEIEAALAYNTGALKYHGKFARLNNIQAKTVV